MEIIPQTVKKYLDKYELQKTFRSDQPVNQDLELADRFFRAGLELAAEIGLFSVETDTVIKVSREEILRAVEDAPDHLDLGEGEDRVIMRARSIGDEDPPVFGGPLAIQVSEELYVPLAAGILQSRDVGVQIGPSIDTIYGRPLYSGTAFETVAGIRENSLRREAQHRAGRPGIANEGTASSTTEYGQLGGFAGLTRKSNPAIALILHPAELKACASGLHKIAVAIGYGGYIDSGTPSMIGGYSGGGGRRVPLKYRFDVASFCRPPGGYLRIYLLRYPLRLRCRPAWDLGQQRFLSGSQPEHPSDQKTDRRPVRRARHRGDSPDVGGRFNCRRRIRSQLYHRGPFGRGEVQGLHHPIGALGVGRYLPPGGGPLPGKGQ